MAPDSLARVDGAGTPGQQSPEAIAPTVRQGGDGVRRPAVSILVNNYNYGRFLSAAIESALAQTYENCEVIVVDDGSSDESRDVLYAYANRITTIFKTNGGQPSALNAGIRHCAGEIVALLDADDTFHPDKLAELVAIAAQFPEAAWIYHELDYIDETGIAIAPDGRMPPAMVHGIRERARRLAPHARIDLRADFQAGRRPAYVCPALSALAFRRRAWQSLFPVPEALGPAGDEFPKWVATALFPGVHIARPLASQRLHARNASTKLDFVDRGQITRYLKTAYYVRERYPHLWRTTDRWFAAWYGDLLGAEGRRAGELPEARAYLKRYLRGARRMTQAPRIAYHVARTAFSR